MAGAETRPKSWVFAPRALSTSPRITCCWRARLGVTGRSYSGLYQIQSISILAGKSLARGAGSQDG
jgi:hypothetical protein